MMGETVGDMLVVAWSAEVLTRGMFIVGGERSVLYTRLRLVVKSFAAPLCGGGLGIQYVRPLRTNWGKRQQRERWVECRG